MKWILAISALLAALGAQAATVEHDVSPSASAATHCGYYLDSAPRVLVPVTAPTPPTTQRKCAVTFADTLSPGTHSVIWTYVVIDAIWGSTEGPQSSPPFTFAKPSATLLPAPSNTNTRLVQ